MPAMPQQVAKGSHKRHTWPRTVVEHLETIPESPVAPADFDNSAATSQSKPVIDSSTRSNVVQFVVDGRNTEELKRAQMLWYSHHLAESQQDREKLNKTIIELETAYRAQSKANAELRRNLKSWQNSYDIIEAELVEAAQEIEEARAYVRSIETSNANLRYALSQIKEQTELEKQKRWRFRLQRWITELPEHFTGLFQSRKTNCRSPAVDHSREGSETPIMRSRNNVDRSGAFSRLDKRVADPELPSSSPQQSPQSEKG